MANKYARDSYHVLLFDRYGTKQDTIITAGGYGAALDLAQDTMDDDGSYVILRVLINSLDNHENWRAE